MSAGKERPVKKYELDAIEAKIDNSHALLVSINSKVSDFVTTEQMNHKLNNIKSSIRLMDGQNDKDILELEKRIDLKYEPTKKYVTAAVLALITSLSSLGFVIFKGVL